MIGTVTANPCIDKTVTVQKFDLYAMNRVEVLRLDPSGKGINVSKVLRAFEGESICTGFDFAKGGRSVLADDLDCLDIPHDFLTLEGDLRLCTKIFDESRKHTVEINEKGETVCAADGEALLKKMKEVAKRCAFLTLSGSLPRGLEKDFYAKCVAAVKRAAPACRVVVDCEGELLLNALAEAPYLIKPNIHEFEGTFGCKIESVAQLDAKALELFGRFGVEMICVSLGGEGAYIATRKEAYFASPAKVEVRSLQGAGDAMVAGICMALEKGLPLADVLRYGVAAAGAQIATDGTAPGERAHFEALLESGLDVTKIR